MDRAKTIKRIENLNKIRAIVEIAKFDTLQKLSKAQKIKDYHYEIAKLSQEVILFAKKNSKVIYSPKKEIITQPSSKKLYIFITIPSKLLKVSYSKFEDMLVSHFNPKQDSIIAVGDVAINFAKKKMFQTIMTFNDLDTSLDSVVALVNNFLINYSFDEIYIVANAPQIVSAPFKIFPINLPKVNAKDFRRTKFYYSISQIVENISNSYIENIISGIYQETYRQFFKEKLAKHESSISSIDAKIKLLKSDLNKIERKKETEEIIQVTQIAKRK